MPKNDYSKAFAIFANNEVKTAKIAALGGAEIKYRELTMDEADGFSSRIFNYGKEDGTPDVDYAAANEIKYEKAALVLVEPKMTVEQLKALPAKAVEAITEINKLVDPVTEEDTDTTAGN